eukprot:126098-Pleurochrysis_carterae.AAC.1
MLVIVWCAHVGSSLGSSSPRIRWAASRAAAADRSFIVDAGAKFNMRGSMALVMPSSRRSAAVSRSDSLNASAFASDVLLWSMVKSSAVASKLSSASRRESSWARYLV